jgi:hypothetical protein
MAKMKMLKMPKAPKASASIAVKERYLQKLAEVKKENAKRASLNKKSEELDKKIAGARSSFHK